MMGGGVTGGALSIGMASKGGNGTSTEISPVIAIVVKAMASATRSARSKKPSIEMSAATGVLLLIEW